MIFATNNKHKLREMRELLPELELEELPPEVTLPPEHGDSFAGIALDKARTACSATGRPALADDSGIEVEALSGRPGIHSARYGGEGATDEENLAKLLDEVAATDGGRRAAYVCALALVEPDGSERIAEARCEGCLIEEPRGDGGFGYDPAFVPDETGPGDERTMSELSQDEKNAISHRGHAARLMAEQLGLRSAADGRGNLL